VEFGVLGPLQVMRDGAEVDLGPLKQRTLLALLLVHVGRVVSTDRILEELWGAEAAGKEQALWVYVSRLRSALEPERAGRGASGLLQTRDHGYVLAIEPECVDSVQAEALIEDARRTAWESPTAAAAMFCRALEMWRGDTLEEFTYHDFARHAIARFEELRISAAEDRFDALLRSGDHAAVVGEIESFQRRHPTRERPIAQLMLAAYRSGRHVDALRAFERFRRYVGEELGVVPSPELQRLEEQILLHDDRLRPPPGTATIVTAAGVANPFMGLRPFDEADAASFVGRERLVADVVRRVGDGERLVTLVGPSGSGKSSLLGAGVVAALRKDALEGSAQWEIARMLPGAHPRAELEAALLHAAIDGPDSLADVIADEELGLLRAALQVRSGPDGRVVLVIDQFEELFTTTDEGRRERFLSGLLPVIDDPHGRIVVIVAVRSDFYDRLLEHPGFATRMSSGIVNVVALQPDELERAMQEPLDQAMVGFERALMATLITDVVGRPASLPLFQYTLTELFDRSDGEALTLAGYRQLGGVSGVIGATADRLFEGLSEPERTALRAVLLRLVTVEESGQRARRRVEASELLSLDLDVVEVEVVLDTFGRHRLLSFDRSAATGAPTVELAHEALLTEWGRLREWIDDAHDDIRHRVRLDRAIAEWIEAGRDPEFLPTGGRLAEYERWASAATIGLDETQRDFLRRAVTRRDDEDHDHAERERAVVTLRRRARRRSWALVAVLVVAALAAGGVVVVRHLEAGVTRVAIIEPFRDGSGIGDQLANGLADAVRGGGVRVDEARPVSDVESEVRRLLDSGPDLAIVPANFAVVTGLDISTLAHDYPHVRLLMIDGVPPNPLPPNFTWLTFPQQDGSFLAGAAAALTSTTGKIGFVGGFPGIVEPFRAGYEAGARAVDPSIEVLSTYPVGQSPLATFQETDTVRSAALDLYRRGADVVFHAAGTAGRGVADAATAESTRTGRQMWAIGVDVDEWVVNGVQVRDQILTSLLKRHDLAVASAISLFRAGKLPTGHFEFALRDDSMDLARSGDHLDADSLARIDQLRTAVADGTITVPDVPAHGPTVVADADETIQVTYDGSTCTATPTSTTAATEDVMRVDMTNTSSSPVTAEIVILAGPDSADPTGATSFTEAEVAPHGTQVLTGRVSPNHFGVGCWDGVHETIAAEVTVPDEATGSTSGG
jgi:basic membrane lipoprotein Med (substrate-binding protein (PBP1-ABC) superfamily)/DNA-binding SARP family transcriptional activator